MNWFTKAFTSTIGRKLVMALTGLFLCLFLVVHASGNFQLFKDDGGMSFNTYSYFMTHNPLIKTISYLLYATFIIHILQSLVLTINNRKARPQGYVKNSPDKNSAWSSRNMGILGTIILVFLVIHMKDFWWEYHNGEIPYKKYYSVKFEGEVHNFEIKDSAMSFSRANDPQTKFMDILKKRGVNLNELQNNPAEMQKLQMEFMQFTDKYVGPEEMKTETLKDLYAEVAEEFKNEYIVLLYLLAMIALSFHLIHGFQSAWQTVGVNHRKYVPIIKAIGIFFSVAIPAGFAAMPIYFLFK